MNRLERLRPIPYGLLYGGSMAVVLGAFVLVLTWAGSSAGLWMLVPVIGYGAVMGIRAGRSRQRESEQWSVATDGATDA